MPLRNQLLLRLEGGRFHTGTALGAEFGITRSAVNKHIAALRAQGIPVHSVPGKGYRLDPSIRFLDRQRICEFLSGDARSIIELHVVRSLTSTSDYLRQLSRERSVKGIACLTESQHTGRGRGGNRWVATPYRNLMLSFGWEYPQWPDNLTTVSLAVSVAVARELSDLGVRDIGVKWPNDLLWRERKLGGILIDVHGETAGTCSIVIGIGINVDISDSDGERIPQPWTDLSAALGAGMDRNLLAGRLITALTTLCGRFPDTGFEPWAADWGRLHVLSGRKVRVAGEQFAVVGTARGIDDSGALLVVDECGCCHRFFHGDVSVRPQ